MPASSGALEAIGWGQTSDNSELADELNWIPVTTVSNEECRITYGNQLTDGMVCIVGSFNEGACTVRNFNQFRKISYRKFSRVTLEVH